MDAVVHGLAQLKKATGIATMACWLLLVAAYGVALLLGTGATFSQSLFTNLYEKTTGVFGQGFGLLFFLGMIFYYPIGDESNASMMDKVLGAVLKTLGTMVGVGIVLLLAIAVLQLGFEVALAFARWLQTEGIPAWKTFCTYLLVGWFVMMAICLTILLLIRDNRRALQVVLELLFESVQEVAEFFLETIWGRGKAKE